MSSITSSESDDSSDDLPEVGVNDLLDAIHGIKMPNGSFRMLRVGMQAVVSGIRQHDSFAMSSEVAAVAKRYDEIARARNARLIMSNKIPDAMLPEHVPYCIWHPDVPSEDTCRRLVQRHPDMKYHVGRTCAVAGYVGLYRELDLLPDVSIAEEAREAGSISLEIYEDITQRLVRYSVMDDYTRKVDSEHPRQGAFINCDAAVKSLLEIRRNVRHYCKPYIPQTRSLRSDFDITEDGGIDGHDSAGEHNPPLAERHVPLLYSPLPLDLPTMNKDVLILMAAYEGNVDRYVRLRRPVMIPEEAQAVIRGIYHNTTFAKWWSLEVKSCTAAVWHLENIRAAFNARFIMNNDLSAVFTLPPPYLIWYPLWPQEATLEKLADMNPAMHLQIAHACIVADYRRLYDTLGVRPSWILWWESRHSYNPYYKADLERRSAELGFDVSSLEEKQKVRSRDINQWCTNRDKEPTDRFLWRELAAVEMVDEQGAGVYDDGFQANATDYNLFICSSETMRAQLPKTGDGWVLYEEYE
ncbi:hypothetical protein N8I77_000030 [Diaporthe amygdali]|uniref:Uncharacterized protein n=1 Tax=Phomopsis amygdali TaxID=1214568 RepID=A0AAD9SMJ9_PHOAM|nr:hypothetical protein N8I77_000030 [Diaporthe amygdali]